MVAQMVSAPGCPRHLILAVRNNYPSSFASSGCPQQLLPKSVRFVDQVAMPTLVAFDVIEFCPVCHRPYHQLIVYVNHEAHIVLLMFEHGYRLCARSPSSSVEEGSVKPTKCTRKSRILSPTLIGF